MSPLPFKRILMEACTKFMAFRHNLCLRWRHESDINTGMFEGEGRGRQTTPIKFNKWFLIRHSDCLHPSAERSSTNVCIPSIELLLACFLFFRVNNECVFQSPTHYYSRGCWFFQTNFGKPFFIPVVLRWVSINMPAKGFKDVAVFWGRFTVWPCSSGVVCWRLVPVFTVFQVWIVFLPVEPRPWCVCITTRLDHCWCVSFLLFSVFSFSHMSTLIF